MKKGESRSSRLLMLSLDPVASTTPRGLPAWGPQSAPGTDTGYAGAGVPPVIGGRIGFSGLVEGSFSFAPGSSC